jgi:nucleotide-binding universal stress UspA family protein
MTTDSPPQTIVVATDFSANADVALAWGVHLGREHGARLVLVRGCGPERRVRGFSEDTTRAAQAAWRSVGVDGSGRRLVPVHAYHVAYESTFPSAPVLMDAIGAADARVGRTLRQRAAPLRAAAIAVDAVARDGGPCDAIIEQAIASHADLIATGTHRLSGLDGLLVGGVAERVVAPAPCPVRTVRCPSD